MEYERCLPLYDIHQVAWLHHNDVDFTGNKQGGRVVFEVPATEETHRLLQEYQSNPTVFLLDFVRSLRRVRARMLDLRDGNGRRERETAHGNDISRIR
jgi:hypothetical protein